LPSNSQLSAAAMGDRRSACAFTFEFGISGNGCATNNAGFCDGYTPSCFNHWVMASLGDCGVDNAIVVNEIGKCAVAVDANDVDILLRQW